MPEQKSRYRARGAKFGLKQGFKLIIIYQIHRHVQLLYTMQKRRPRVTLRAKARTQRNRRAASLLLLAFLSCGLVYQAPKAWATVSKIDAPQWSRWHFQGVRVKCANPETAAAIAAAVRFPSGVEVSTRDCAVVARAIEAAFPAVNAVKVSRNWFTKQLEIKADMRVPIAVIADGRLVDENGRLYTVNISTPDMAGLFHVSAATAAPVLPAHAVILVKAVQANAELFPSKPVKLCCLTETTEVFLKDGTRIKWGGEGFVREKAMRVAQVYNKTSGKFPAPYNIDLSYFEDGKILLSQAQAVSTQTAKAL